MSDGFSVWLVMPMAVSLFAAVLAFGSMTAVVKRYRPFRSNLISAIVMTALVMLTGATVYFLTNLYASREENRATKDWWQLLEEGDERGAEKKLTRHLARLEREYGRVDADHSPFLFNLAHVYAAQGRLEDAEELYLKTLELIRSDLADHEQLHIDGLRQTASFYWDIGDYQAAEDCFVKGLEASRIANGEDHGLTIRMLRGLATCHRVQKEYDQAERCFKDLITVLERVDVQLLTKTGEEYASMLVEMGRKDEAEKQRARWAEFMTEGAYGSLMKRRTFLQTTTVAAVGAAAAAFGQSSARADAKNRPNILWISCEDISAHLGCYGDAEATTPNLDALAAQGARYDHAYSICGVCAPSRSCIITGMYPPSIGTMHMRCNNPPPPHVRCFPEYLQEAGYYCTNNVKTDYNFPPPKTAWNESSRNAHWRNRPNPDQPFFAVFNITITHESRIGTPPEKMGEGERALLPEKRHDPANAKLPPYYPDTPVIREHWAHYYDLITAMDAQSGEILRQLEEDGLANNTIVMWFSDHGVGLPRAKRWLYDSGLNIPMIVRWPGVIEPGSVRDELVSFVDFAPTVLSLAGVTPPEHMQGQVVLGDNAAPPREFIYGMRDRMDERYDHIRAVRDKRFKYIRNYELYRAYDQYLEYPESYPVMQDMRRVQAAGELNDVQTLFFRQAKPLEELYDTDADPHELNNVALDPGLADQLDRMRKALDAWEDSIDDLGAIPEFALEDWLYKSGADANYKHDPYVGGWGGGPYGWSSEYVFERLFSDDRRERVAMAKASMMGRPLLKDDDPLVVYWGAVALAYGAEGAISDDVWKTLAGMLNASEVALRLGAATVFAAHGRIDDAIPALIELIADEKQYVRLYAVQIAERVGSDHAGVKTLLETALDDRYNDVKKTARHALGG